MIHNLADACIRQVGCHHFTHGQGQFIVWCLVIAAIVWVLIRIFK